MRDPGKMAVDVDTLRAVITYRFHVMARYAQDVVRQVHKEEIRQADKAVRGLLKRVRKLMIRDEMMMSDDAKRRLQDALQINHSLMVVYQFRLQLQELWNQKTANPENLLQSLQEWCRQAEATGIQALQEFAENLRGYTLQTA